jgi:hypothetical protein
MAFQVSPGVNVSEIDATNVTAVAGTSTGALAGQLAWGPANKRILVDSENTLVSVFGKPTPNTYQTFFSAANFLAYTNKLLVVRAVGSTTYNAVANNAAIPTSIANEDVWENLYDFRVGQTGAVNLGSFVSRYPGELGNSLGIAICSDNDSFRTSTLYANTVASSNQIVLSANVSLTYPNFKANDILTVSGTDYTISSISGNTITTSSSAVSTQNTQPAVISWKYSSVFTRAPNTSIYATTQNGLSDELHIAVVDTNGKISGVQGTILEKYESVSKAIDAKTDDGSSNYYANIIFDKSKYIYVANHLTGHGNWGTNSSGTTFSQLTNYEVALTGGTSTAPQTADIVSAYDLFANPSEVDVSLIISGEPDLTIANKVLSLAVQRKDAVAFISPLRQDVVNSFNLDNIIAYKNSLSPTTSYGLMDSGFKYQFDKYNNVYRYVALNADIAGLCARTDSVRDPWWSPAGFNRGQILNAIKLAWNPTKAQSDLLYQNNINTVSAFPGEGIVLFGDKTLQGKASAFDRINVRRLFIVLEKTIANAAKYSLFEFNDAFTRSQFVSIVEPFLRDVQARRGIYDYKVICDETNNTSQVIDSNGFVGDIYIKPAKSINYIQLNFVAVRTGVDFSEIAGIA